MCHRLGRELGEFFRVDADREYRRARLAMARGDDAVANGQLKVALDVGEEVLAILFGLETDQVTGQHRLDQLAMMRHAADHGARRPWRVQEEADRLGDAEIAQFRAERKEVIVLDPERGVRLLEAQQRPRHEGVHLTVADVVFLGRADQVGTGMQRRPQRRIGKTFVVAAVMRRRQVEHGERARTQGLDLGERFLGAPVAHATAGADPNRAGFLDNRQQSCGESPRHGFVGFTARNAVGYDDEVHQVPSCYSRAY